MCEGVEAVFAVVSAHAAGAHPAEGELLDPQVHDGVVDADAAARCLPGEQVRHLARGILCKCVNNGGLFLLVYSPLLSSSTASQVSRLSL